MAETAEGQEARRKAWREKATQVILARLKEIGAPPDGFAAFEPGGSRWVEGESGDVAGLFAAELRTSASDGPGQTRDVGAASDHKRGAGVVGDHKQAACATGDHKRDACATVAGPPEGFYEWFSGMLPPTPVPGVDYWDPLREGLVQALKWAAKERGENLSLWDFCQLTRVTAQLVKDRFGSWGRLREASGLSPQPERPKAYEDEEIFDLVRALVKEVGPELTLATFREHTGLSAAGLYHRFGGWQKLCQRAGVTVRARRGPRPEYSRESILAALTEFVKAGRTRICLADFSQLTGISADAIIHHWRSWSALRRAAGLSVREIPQPLYSDDDLLAEFDRVVRKLGRVPSRKDFDAEGCCSSVTLMKRFGRKRELLRRWEAWRERQPTAEVHEPQQAPDEDQRHERVRREHAEAPEMPEVPTRRQNRSVHVGRLKPATTNNVRYCPSVSWTVQGPDLR